MFFLFCPGVVSFLPGVGFFVPNVVFLFCPVCVFFYPYGRLLICPVSVFFFCRVAFFCPATGKEVQHVWALLVCIKSVILPTILATCGT